MENQLWQALAEVGADEERTESVAGEEGRGRLESGGAGRPTASLRGRLHAVRRGVPQALMEKIKGTWESSVNISVTEQGNLGPDGLHQGDHRSEQCHWQVGDPHEQGVQRARGRDRDHGGGDSDGWAS